MTRLPAISDPRDPAVVEDLTRLTVPGLPTFQLFLTLAHNPRVLGRIRRGGLLDPGSIPVRARELVILRTTALCGSEYEWGVHVLLFAQAAGLGPAELAATVTGDPAPFTPAERLLFELCDALHGRAEVPDELWQRLAVEYRADQLVELVTLAGQYHTISYLTNAFQLAPEPKAPRFPAAVR